MSKNLNWSLIMKTPKKIQNIAYLFCRFLGPIRPTPSRPRSVDQKPLKSHLSNSDSVMNPQRPRTLTTCEPGMRCQFCVEK